MAQADYNIEDQSGLSFLSELNNTLGAILSNNSGPTAPADTEPYMWWADTTSGILKQRNAADDGWVNFLTLGSTALETANNLSDLVNAATARTNLDISAANTPYDNTDSGSSASNVKAALDGALIGRKNFIINGVAPFVNQEGDKTGASSGDYIADVWRYISTNDESFDLAVSTVGDDEWIEADITSADTTISTNTFTLIRCSIEGLNVAPLKLGTSEHKTVTLSFKHRHTKAGTYCVSLRNGSFDRGYVFEYEQSASDAEETHEETIELDASGTWLVNNQTGLNVEFILASGSDRHTIEGTWQSVSGQNATANQVNALDTVGNKFRIRDIQLEIGSVATEPEYIPYSEKLAQVQRYYLQESAINGGALSYKYFGETQTSAFNATVWFPAEMRDTPVATTNWNTFINCSEASHNITTTAANLRVDVTSAGDYRAYGSGTFMVFDARLS